MLETLYRTERELPRLLDRPEIWESLLVDYHPPIVERLWCRREGYRLLLHRIHPCLEGEALFHRHGQPSAVRIVSGKYEMGVGFGFGSTPPPVAVKEVLVADSEYEMADPNSWHYVRPLEVPSLSVMVTGAPWSDVIAPKSDKPLGPLSLSVRRELLDLFRAEYK